MPTYHYRCSACGHEFEAFQKFADDPLTECPECAGEIKRVLQPVGVVFKGSGWYITDSRKGGDSKSTSSTAAAPAKPAETPAATAAPEAIPAKAASTATPKAD